MWFGDIKTINIWRPNPEKEEEKLAEHLIEELGLSPRPYNALKREEYNTVKDVIDLIRLDRLPHVKGIGAGSINEIKLKVSTFMA